MQRILSLLALVFSVTLIGCNNDGSSDPISERSIQQKGFGGSELYGAARNPTGHVIQSGETAVLAWAGRA